MFKLTNRITLVALCIFSFNAQANTSPQTVESCSKLLPEGRSYEIAITANVDKSKATPSFTGEFSVTGGTDEAMNFDISEFVECVAPLIKNTDKPEK
ncbi:MAG: hypothetical protein QNK26_16400 [Moritella sp.]|uniref:hypothetical protein n=1 Tax=Moritella sp. TaxID=78556 RepID=UPI0029B3098E|nr:hypothetical protein [Moritella sp.]MDX2322167.1 hypothetical protein [Moritella sp.]